MLYDCKFDTCDENTLKFIDDLRIGKMKEHVTGYSVIHEDGVGIPPSGYTGSVSILINMRDMSEFMFIMDKFREYGVIDAA